jgi:phospholipase/carboxylesterase
LTAPDPDCLAILLHGVDANGRDLDPLGGALQRFLPRARFASPDAPERSEHDPGFQWFSIAGVTPVNRPSRVQAARAGFDRLVRAQVEAAGFAGKLDRVAFVGFSQGSIMALDALATGRWPIAALVAFSGRLASPEPLAPKPGARALLIHGEADPVIPADETQLAAKRLRELGVAVEAHLLARVGHTISSEGIALAGNFLVEILSR